jgi:vancomycin resistance protein YoaR
MRAISYSRRKQQEQFLLEQLVICLLAGTGLFLIGTILIFIGFQLRYLGVIYPGVSVGGISVGGLTPDEASQKISAAFAYPQSGKILLRYGDKSWVMTPGKLGLFLDPDGSAQNAYHVGRTGGIIQSLDRQFSSLYYGADVSVSMVFDQRMAYNALTGMAATIDKPMTEPTLAIQDAQVVVQSGQTGYSLDIASTLNAVSAQISSMRDGVVDLDVHELKPSIGDVSAQADQARKILSQPLTLKMPDGQPDQLGPYVIDPATLAGMLKFEQVQGQDQTRYELAVDRTLLQAYLQSLADPLHLEPQNTRFTFNDDTHQLEVIQPAVIGRSLDVQTNLDAIQKALLSGEHEITLSLTTTKPEITDDKTGADLGITELVSSNTSYFRGSSEDRLQNIKIAASRFHGLLIPPNTTFSMASALGDVNLDNGYAEAVIIVGNTSVKGVGGGVCQVSTTLFRTAFFGGYPIVERHAHAYRVYYYEQVSNGHDGDLAGLDATVFVPLVDFKFTNDTPYWLLMETYFNPTNYSLTWKFYSTKDGRSVDWHTTGPTNLVEPPEPSYAENADLPSGEVKQVDYAAQGADITVDRTVTKNGSVYFQDSFTTHYEAWQEKWEYGPGTEGMPPNTSSADQSSDSNSGE